MENDFILSTAQLVKVVLEQNDTNLVSCDNVNTFIDVLDGVFNEWRNKIDEEHSKPYVTNVVEDNFSLFAEKLAVNIVKYKETFMKISKEKIIKLFEYRHLGYGFYREYDNTKGFLDQHRVYANKLYCSMIEYFSKYFGKFSDNELAIDMICKYYHYGNNLNKRYREILVIALYKHCSMAGEATDVGFAFRGIREIKDGFKKIPEDIIVRIIEKYKRYEVLNDKTYRKQIHTMIFSSNFNDKMKSKLKFFYIDSIILMHQLSIVFYRIYKDEYDLLHISIDRNNIGKNKILNFESNNKQIKFLWNNVRNRRGRQLKLNSNIFLEIRLNESDIEIKIANNNKTPTIRNLIDDYTLDQYVSDDFYKQLEELFIAKESEIKYEKFIFSHIWIDNYRKIEKQQLSFDNKFSVNFDKNTLIIRKNNNINTLPLDFFRNSIYSVSAIVGKNGAGKTSIIEFLRDTFFNILYGLDEGYDDIHIIDGMVSENKYIKNDEKYLVIFYINEQPYFMTNYPRVNYLEEEIQVYMGEKLKRNSENSKLIYFSNMIDPDVSKIRPIVMDEEGGILRQVMSNISFIDYSENDSYIERSNEYNQYYNNLGKNEKYTYLNSDFWYKMAFLDTYRDLTEFLGENFEINNLKCTNYNKEFENKVKNMILDTKTDLIDNILSLDLEELTSSIIKLTNFSAGQYAKFSFLSRLFWCLEGYNKYHKRIEDVIGKNVFYIMNTISKNSTAVIFIDEGEVYYHPKWQQEYVDILIKFINKYTKDKNVKIQVVLTSNSPFIISDIPANNILFLPNNEKKNIKTFGANIYDLCRNGFFLGSSNYGVLGDFATRKIEEVEKILIKWSKEIRKIYKESEEKVKETSNGLDRVQEEKLLLEKLEVIRKDNISNIKEKAMKELDECKKIIDIIGEQLIRKTLLKQYNEIYEIINIERKSDSKILLEMKDKFEELSKADQNELIKFIIDRRNN